MTAGPTSDDPLPTFAVRRAELDDAPSIARVHVASWQVGYRGQLPDALLDGQSLARRLPHWQRQLTTAEHGILVGVAGSGVVGFSEVVPSRDADAAPGAGELTTIYIDPPYWRRGVGRALLRASIDAARARGYRELTLWVLESNARARAFYAAFGFAPDGLTKVVQNPTHVFSEARYRRELGEAAEGGA